LQLAELVAQLISWGHIGAWDYGFYFFKIACNSLESQQKALISSMAGAIGLAFSDKKKWKEFFEEGK